MFGRQLTGLAIDGAGAVAVEAERQGSLWSLKRSGASEGAGGGGADMHHLSVAALKEMSGGALGEAGIKKANLSLSIPDALARTVILDFDELPSRSGEARGVIEWKIAKSMYLAPEDICVGYQVLPAPASALKSGVGGVRVLAVAIKREALERYEDALFELGCSVGRVGTHTLSLLNLIADSVEGISNFAVVFIMGGVVSGVTDGERGGYFSVSFFKDGVIDFYRSKSVGKEAGQLATEVGTSFTFYRGRNHGIEFERTLLVNGDDEAARLIRSVTGTDVLMVGAGELIIDGDGRGGDETALIAALGAASF